tara:strand:- start:95 stop:328 length:234 start_codon:yes stop_codon:yes gene_type:complete
MTIHLVELPTVGARDQVNLVIYLSDYANAAAVTRSSMNPCDLIVSQSLISEYCGSASSWELVRVLQFDEPLNSFEAV